MFNFEIKVKGRKAVPVEKKKGVSGSVNVDSVSFDFSSEEWENTTKTAVFYVDKETVYEQLLDSDNRAKIPWELLQSAGEIVKVGVYGVYGTGDDRVVITSTIVEIEIKEGTIVGANADPGEYENIYIQILSRLQELMDSLFYETSIVPEWTHDEDTQYGSYYITQISQKKIKVTAMNDAVVVEVSRPGKEPIYIHGADKPAVYSEEGFTLRYYNVVSSNTPPEIKIYDNLYKRKIAGVVQDHDITALELLNECWQYLNSTYLSSGTKFVGLNLKDNITASDLFYALQSENDAKAHPGGGNYGIVKLANPGDTRDWNNCLNNEVGTIFNIANAIRGGAWSDSQMSDLSNNIVKNSVIKAYVDTVRNDKQNQIKQVVVNDGYWVDLEAYPGVKMYDLVTTTMGHDLWSCYAVVVGKAYVNKIASVGGISIAENAYTKSEVNALIGAIEKLTKRKVQELPETGEDNVIYLVPKTGETDDVYDEWMWIDNQWEHFGNTQIDLSGYVPTSRTIGRLNLNRDVSNTDFAIAIITAIVNDSGSAIYNLLMKLNEYFQTRQSGKGLSTEDYTTAEKTKLAGLSNYDDTEIREEIEDIQKDLNLKIIQQPPATIVAGVSNVVSLSVVAVGDNLTYQWQKSTDNGVTWTDSTGQTATADTLQFTMVADYNKRMFRCLVTDENSNTVLSNPATIVLDGLVRNTDYAQNNASTGGVVKYGNGIYGIKSIEGGTIGIVKPTDAEIEAQSSGWRVLTPAHISKVVKAGLTNNSATLSAAEKKSARDWIGAEGETWEKMLEKTLQSDSSTALDFSDVDFNGDYKKIKILIQGTMATNNANITLYRMNSSTAYVGFGNAGKSANSVYEINIEEKPFLINNGTLRNVCASLDRYGVTSTNEWTNGGKVGLATESMADLYEIKITSSANFIAGTKVVVYGIK